ncbi:carboxy-terminal kinesin 2 [Ixodes scapularis]|uniref:carboxy-terminal kinesin 2 n=1 Tax=Ixodes scapularis TaxID=6945 RepID=UPI001C3898FA|nr:carboxy-terminal kinesin 2 [Ixodes scapularis]
MSASGSSSGPLGTTPSTQSKPLSGAVPKRTLRAPTPTNRLGNPILKRSESLKENLDHHPKRQRAAAPTSAATAAKQIVDLKKRLRRSRSTCDVGRAPLTSAASRNALKASGSTFTLGSLASKHQGSTMSVAPSAPKSKGSGSSAALVPSAAGKRKPWDLQGRVKDLEELVSSLAGDKKELQILHKEKEQQVEVLIKDNSELQVQLEHVKRLTLENDSLKEQLRHKTNEVAKVTAELESTMTKLGCCQREKQSLQETVSQLTGNYAGLRAEHSAMQLLLQNEQEKCLRLAESLSQSQQREAEKDQQLQDAEMMRRDLHNMLQELKGNIRVFCRVRPMLPSEEGEGERPSRISFPDEKTVELVKPDTEKVMAFPFDRVFPGSATQAEVYEEVAHVVQSALDGYNVCIFAYGQTGSGKTFTMEGPPDLDLGCPNDSQLGLIPRALQQVFMSAQELQNTHQWEFTMVASYLEIYNENVRDLLSTRPRSKQTACQIKQEKDGSMMVTNATKTTVTSPEQIYELLRRARKHRAVGATQCNEHSSRSHSVFQLRITGTNRRTGVGSRGLLNLVDLCGSERLDESKAEGARLRETQHINRSLSNLGNVILALSQKAEHVPYRNSKLTFLLMDSLGGNSKTLMLLNVSPREKNLAETINSLRFATTVNQCDIGTAHRTMLASSHY